MSTRGRPSPPVEIVPLGAWGGLVAEYDARARAIRVDAGSVARIRARLGDEAATTFVRCAVAHESFHARRPASTEAQAHAFARRVCGVDPAVFAAILRERSTC